MAPSRSTSTPKIASLAKSKVKGKDEDSQNPLADLGISRVYAAGASQSGRFLGVYYNTVQPLRHVYDGFLFALSDSSLPPRDGVGTKAIRVFTENDIYRGSGVPSQTVPDGPTLRTWEIAGASHVPAYRRQVADDVRRLEGQGFLLPEDGHVFTDAARHRHV